MAIQSHALVEIDVLRNYGKSVRLREIPNCLVVRPVEPFGANMTGIWIQRRKQRNQPKTQILIEKQFHEGTPITR